MLLIGILYAERNYQLMLVVLVSEQSISIRSFLYLKQNITVSRENGKYDKFIKKIAHAELASPESSLVGLTGFVSQINQSTLYGA